MKKTSSAMTVFLIVCSALPLFMPRSSVSGTSSARLLIGGPSNEAAPAMFQDSQGKSWLFFISDRSDHYQVYFSTSVDNAQTWSDPLLFSPAVSTQNILDPAVLQDSFGRIWVAWRNVTGGGDQLWFTTSDDGTNWALSKMLCPGHNDMGGFIEKDGRVWFFFSDGRVSYKTTDNGGNSWSDPAMITSAGMRTPYPTVLANGTIFVVYRIGYSGYDPHPIGYSESSDAGASWQSGVVDDPTYPENDNKPGAIEYGSRIFVFFVRAYDESNPPCDIWFRVYDEGQWKEPEQLTADDAPDDYPWPAIVCNQLWLVWNSFRNGNSDIWASGIAPAQPEIYILSPENKTFYSRDIPLTVNLSEPTSWIGYSLDNQANVTIYGNTTIYAEEGPHQIVVCANDTFGHMGSSATVSFSVEIHDIAVQSVNTSKTGCTPLPVVCQNHTVNINAVVENLGIYNETFNLSIYANTTLIETRSMTLTGMNVSTETFVWDTTGFPKGNYTIIAYAEPVLHETSTSDNTLEGDWIIVAWIGDINYDGKVDVKDVYKVGLAFGTSIFPPNPPGRNYNPNSDINNDGKVDVKDYYIVCKHYGEVDPLIPLFLSVVQLVVHSEILLRALLSKTLAFHSCFAA